MVVEKRKKKGNVKFYFIKKERWLSWFKASDCKSVEFSHHRFESYSFQFIRNIAQYGSALVLGTRGHVFKSHCFEKLLKICINFKLTNKNW